MPFPRASSLIAAAGWPGRASFLALAEDIRQNGANMAFLWPAFVSPVRLTWVKFPALRVIRNKSTQSAKNTGSKPEIVSRPINVQNNYLMAPLETCKNLEFWLNTRRFRSPLTSNEQILKLIQGHFVLWSCFSHEPFDSLEEDDINFPVHLSYILLLLFLRTTQISFSNG